jgi:hypothetical protein
MKRVSMLLLALSAFLIASPPASGHVSESRSYWYWDLMTFRGYGPEDLDPIMIVWTHGTLAPNTSHGAVQSVVRDRWWRHRTSHPNHQGFTFDQVCLGQGRVARRIRDSGIQWVSFRFGRSSWLSDGTDFQGSTSGGCLDQWHMRFWDDHEHAINTDHGREQQWVISGVHHDISTGSFVVCVAIGACRRYGTGHRVSGRWVKYRNYAVNRALASLCSRARWRQFPGR